ncbi:MAG: helix-turn-helix domain-containing protein [Candidatus Margulisiibacteriota bacterium]
MILDSLDKESLSNGVLKEHKGDLYRFFVEALEKRLIERVLEHTGGNKLKAASLLGINRNTIRSKIRKYCIWTK